MVGWLNDEERETEWKNNDEEEKERAKRKRGGRGKWEHQSAEIDPANQHEPYRDSWVPRVAGTQREIIKSYTLLFSLSLYSSLSPSTLQLLIDRHIRMEGISIPSGVSSYKSTSLH